MWTCGRYQSTLAGRAWSMPSGASLTSGRELLEQPVLALVGQPVAILVGRIEGLRPMERPVRGLRSDVFAGGTAAREGQEQGSGTGRGQEGGAAVATHRGASRAAQGSRRRRGVLADYNTSRSCLRCGGAPGTGSSSLSTSRAALGIASTVGTSRSAS